MKHQRGQRLWRFMAGAICAVAVALNPVRALGQNGVPFPQRPVTLVVAGAPGTGADILARSLAGGLSERWGVALVTDNRVGASGTIGSSFVARSAPDGHTLLFVPTSFATNAALMPLSYDPVKSFTAVSLLATGALAFVINAQVPAKSLREFISLARREPGRLNYASPGSGSPQHLAFELIKLETGIDVLHVPYKGSGTVLTGLLALQTQATVSALQTVGPHVASGKLRMLAIMSAERAKSAPSVPTMREEGFSGLDIETWYGVFAPASTPRATVARINADLNAQLQQPTMKEILQKQGLEPAGGPPERMAQRLAHELALWARAVRQAGVKLD